MDKDLISRQAVLDALKNINDPYVSHPGNDIYWCVKAIEELSSVEPVGNSDTLEWIPCSERLPETEINVLIWLPSHWNKNGGTVEIGFLDEDNEWNWLAESMNGYYEIVEGVSAWMPLPEPYREDGNQ